MAKAKHLSINSKLGLLTPLSRSRYLKSEREFGHEELPRPCNVHRDSVDIENYRAQKSSMEDTQQPQH